MLKRGIGIGFAFIGVVVGAGFASGMEAFQYFVSYGEMGMWGIVLAGVVMAFAAVAFLAFGSYFQANEHTRVFGEVSDGLSSKIMDWSAIACMFSVGFVMFAGAGSNLEQAYGWPIYVGGVAMLVIMLLVGRLDVNKISMVLGLVTPLLIIFVLIASIWTFTHTSVDFASQSEWAQQNVEGATGAPTWWLGALNHTGLNALCTVSMAIVIGGDNFDNKSVRIGGIVAGFLYAAMLALLVVTLFMEAKEINGDDLPLLTVLFNINPALGQVMTWVIFLMVFNTCLGMIYALAKRLTRNNPDNFYKVYVGACLVGFVLSFIGFKPLVANLYPILGYLGLFVIAVLVYQYFRYRDRLDREGELRTAAVHLVTDEENLDPDSEFADMSLDELAEESMLDDEEFQKALQSEVEDENDEDTKGADSADGTDSEGSDAAADSSTGSGSTKI
ncbi:hypothetical protein KBX19_03565 [Corynebacterium sp. CCUG 71335]|uniref:YkvI family membrane protein n=1 Tax=Corynebacterium sp. CCUG 71335 TaxID=2823892 RepID=UPI00210EDB21|nr:hypothetical protein [Corynebacterium sp. CCUG 71335]MCQ4620294.1 hypothetical protein [Corynebacterium sp. CCUG 71335]